MKTNPVTLACSWYPRGELGRFKRELPKLREIYEKIVVAIMDESAEIQMIQAFFEENDVQYQIFSGWSGRYLCVKRAIESGAKYVHYVDFDRLVRWSECHFDELKQVVATIPNQELLILGRTAFAWNTHPRSMFETERLFNTVFSQYFERAMDFGAGSRGMSKNAVEYILRHSDCKDALNMDAGWVVLLKRGGFSWGYTEVDGLEYESADQYKDRAATHDEQKALQVELDLSAENWALRTTVANKIMVSGLCAMTQSLP